MQIEMLAQIRSSNFVAGIILVDDVVTETAPIVRFMRRWSRDRVRDYCRKYRWEIQVVKQGPLPSREMAAVEPGILQHSESFEVQCADGRIEFVYFDDNAGRRAISGRPTRQTAFRRAQELLRS